MKDQYFFKNSFVIGAAAAISIALSGCSGGDAAAPTPTTLSGTAAAGAAIIGTVTVKGALGVTKSALIEADGNYNVDVTGLAAPYRLRAQGTVGGRTYKLHSYALEADVGGNVNITPFTDLIVANAAQQVAESYFDSNTPAELTTEEIDAQETALQAKLQDVFTALGVDAAIDLLNTTFSADHSGIDAALDVISVEVDTATNIATITSVLEPANVITDNLTDSTDNAVTLTVTDAAVLTEAVTDTQAIVARFDSVSAAFANGLPTGSALTTVTGYFADDFLLGDQSKAQLITEISTDPGFIGMEFGGLTVSNIDAVAGTAEVTFNFGINGVFDLESETWFVAKDVTLGWRLRGDQRIVETYFSYHCNDGDGAENLSGTSTFAGACGINTQYWDEDFTNNGTANAPIASGTVKIIDATTSAVKATVYLGTPVAGTAGDVQVYNEEFGNFQGDWKEFGAGIGQIDSAVFAVGDTIEYTLYTADLDTTVQASPTVVGVPVATYTDTVQFVPEVTLSKIPSATATTLTAMSNFTLGNNLTVAWTLVPGTVNNEILVEISDSMGNRVEIWDWNFGSTATSATYSSSQLDTASAGLSTTDATYDLKVRIYAADELTGESHSIDYDVSIPGAGAGGGTPPPVSGLLCGYESGWDDLADGGLGAPITPNSFADYEAVLADCSTAMSFAAADAAGAAFVDAGETTTFNDTAAAGTVADPETGIFDDGAGFVLDFEWYVEAATCSGCTHSYLVMYSDSTIDVDLPAGFSLRETSALMGITGTPGVAGANYSFVKYSEGSNFGDMIRSTGTDGEIWSSPSNVLQ